MVGIFWSFRLSSLDGIPPFWGCLFQQSKSPGFAIPPAAENPWFEIRWTSPTRPVRTGLQTQPSCEHGEPAQGGPWS